MEAAAEILFGNPRAMIKVDCGEFQHSHEIAKLVGSPPGYLGHRETHPVLTREALEQFPTEKLALNFLPFDEVEKASDALWQLLLGILDKATLTLGDNRRVDLSRTLVFLTSKVHRCNRQARGRPGTKGGPNRGGGGKKDFLAGTNARATDGAKVQFLFHVRAAGKDFLLREGTDPRYGAQHLKRAVERYLVCPLANLLATRQVRAGDMLCVDWDRRAGHLVFWKEGRVSELTTSLGISSSRTSCAGRVWPHD